jgi:hypothetical protein
MTRMLRRLVVLCILAAITVGVTASIASADKPVRGCTQNYTLTPVDQTDPIQVSVDKNVDGNICVRTVPVGNGTPPNDRGPNFVDNTTNYTG